MFPTSFFLEGLPYENPVDSQSQSYYRERAMSLILNLYFTDRKSTVPDDQFRTEKRFARMPLRFSQLTYVLLQFRGWMVRLLGSTFSVVLLFSGSWGALSLLLAWIYL